MSLRCINHCAYNQQIPELTDRLHAYGQAVLETLYKFVIQYSVLFLVSCSKCFYTKKHIQVLIISQIYGGDHLQ